MGRDQHSSLLLGLSRVVHALHYSLGLAHPTFSQTFSVSLGFLISYVVGVPRYGLL
ncbi:hypothetical protein GLYMA_17G040600v4 [Glycine max]|uniref:Uncharacterized protein n=2 Tax=Glycine subgen. Soja TaxID=1462606 RepID=K7MJV6_SOYBN|nr:hypothetical protein GYH30_046191 [Glycine max]KRH02469.1 hypothetical protein GLYMA_17G040600v4 [Glycine max]RZB55125.1 hypothetical protein D0Y65_044823 [Glycine soja]